MLTHCASFILHVYHVLQTLSVDVTHLEYFIVDLGNESYLVTTEEGGEPLVSEGIDNGGDVFRFHDDVLSVKVQDSSGAYSEAISREVYEDLRFSGHALSDTDGASLILSGRYQELTLTENGVEELSESSSYYVVTFTGEADKVLLDQSENLIVIGDSDGGETLYLTLSPSEEGAFTVRVYNAGGERLSDVGELSSDAQSIRLKWGEKTDIEVFQGDYRMVSDEGKDFYTVLDQGAVSEEFAHSQNIKLGLTGVMIALLVESFALLAVFLHPFKKYKQLSKSLKKRLWASAVLQVAVTVLVLGALLLHQYVPYGGLSVGLSFLFSVPALLVFIVFLRSLKKQRKSVFPIEDMSLEVIENIHTQDRRRENMNTAGERSLRERGEAETYFTYGDAAGVQVQSPSSQGLSRRHTRNEKRLWKQNEVRLQQLFSILPIAIIVIHLLLHFGLGLTDMAYAQVMVESCL